MAFSYARSRQKSEWGDGVSPEIVYWVTIVIVCFSCFSCFRFFFLLVLLWISRRDRVGFLCTDKQWISRATAIWPGPSLRAEEKKETRRAGGKLLYGAWVYHAHRLLFQCGLDEKFPVLCWTVEWNNPGKRHRKGRRTPDTTWRNYDLDCMCGGSVWKEQ